MNITTTLITSNFLLLLIFIALLLIYLRNGHTNEKVNEDIKKIKDQILD